MKIVLAGAHAAAVALLGVTGLLRSFLAPGLVLHRYGHLYAALQDALLVVSLVTQASMGSSHRMLGARSNTSAGVLRLHLKIGLGLEALASNMLCVLLRAVGQGHLVDWPARVLHTHIVRVTVLFAALMTTTLH